MKKYYLVVRYKETNEVEIVELNSKWYQKNNSDGAFYRANSLEAIDLVTTKFKNKKEMLERMATNGYIKTSRADVFIASRRKKNDRSYLKIHEVIFNPLEKDRVSELRDLASASLNGDISTEADKAKDIFDTLARKVYYDEKFALYLRSTFTNVYQKLMELYVYNNKSNGPDYSVKYNNYWLLSSYSIIRNIVEALNRYELFQNRQDVTMANIDYLNENSKERKKVEPTLLIKLDDNYIPGQYSLFDEDGFINTQKNVQKEKKEKAKINENEDNDNLEEKNLFDNLTLESDEEEITMMSSSDKKIFITDLIRNLPVKLFYIDGDELKINTSFFEVYPNFKYRQALVDLPKRVIRIMYNYALHQEKYLDALKYCQNTLSLEEELRNDSLRLSKYLSNDKNLDRLFFWCNNYLKCVEFETLSLDINEEFLEKEGEKGGSKK